MSRFTVCWHRLAEVELAEIWLATGDRTVVENSANAIDSALSDSHSETTGTAATADLLDAATRATVVQRSIQIPEGLRCIREGPIEVFFTAHPLDRQTKVWLVRRCIQ